MPSKNKVLKTQEKEKQKEELENNKLLDEYWSEGVNKKGQLKTQNEQEKQMEKMRKAKEKQDLLLADDENMNNIKITAKKGKKNKNDDFSLLNQALASAPKTKKQKEQELKLKQQKDRQEKEDLLRVQREEQELQREKERKEALLKNINIDHQDDIMIKINNNMDNDVQISGIDDAINALNENTSTMSFNDYYDEQLKELKKSFPGLRLSQYNDRIHNQWKKSPYNPKNIVN